MKYILTSVLFFCVPIIIAQDAEQKKAAFLMNETSSAPIASDTSDVLQTIPEKPPVDQLTIPTIQEDFQKVQEKEAQQDLLNVNAPLTEEELIFEIPTGIGVVTEFPEMDVQESYSPDKDMYEEDNSNSAASE